MSYISCWQLGEGDVGLVIGMDRLGFLFAVDLDLSGMQVHRQARRVYGAGSG